MNESICHKRLLYSALKQIIDEKMALEYEYNKFVKNDMKVSHIQAMLNTLKFRDAIGKLVIVTGIIDKQTITALQRAAEILNTDNVSDALLHLTSKPFLKLKCKNEIGIRYLQFRCGLDNTGIFDAHTQTMLKHYQKIRKLNGNGTVDLEMWRHFLS